MSESQVVGKEQCPTPGCDGSGDNLVVYDDGHKYCFACGLYVHPDGTSVDASFAPEEASESTTEEKQVVDGNYRALVKRGITEETCRKWRYQVGKYAGRTVQIANYYRDGNHLTGQKIRFPDKDFRFNDLGDKYVLYGQWLWKEGGKKIVVTEGEIDALSVSQMQQNRWPVVSLPHGAQGAKKAIKENLEYLESFNEVILMFDQDEAGQNAVEMVAPLLQPGKVKIASLPLKDANAMLQAGRGSEIINAIWQAKTYRPDGIVSGDETWDMVSQVLEVSSTPYPFTPLNEKSFGMRTGEIVLVTAGSGIGKSSLCRELAYDLFQTKGETVGYIGLEESVAQTARAFMSLTAGTPIHLNPKALSKEEQRGVWEKTLNHDRIHLYDHWGSVDSDNLLGKLRYMAKGLGCRWLFLDHISIMISGGSLETDERRSIDKAMTNFRSFVEEAKVGMFIVSHLKKPGNGKPFEEGGQISLADLRGSGALYQLSDLVLGLERNQQDEMSSNISTVRWLKNRFSGMTGVSGELLYNSNTGRFEEYVGGDARKFGFSGCDGETDSEY